MPYVYSTLTCDNEYAEWVKTGDQQSILRSVKVNGGHGVMNKHFTTPLGVVTEVTDDELAFLEANDHFQFHKKNGFISVDKKKVDTEKVAVNMKQKDNSSPITPADYAKGGKFEGIEAPTVSGGN